ncbi:F-box only protein 27 [Sceloporus undulatus]|uniref:F-box only protein 27 n=1 Tax=Sceloporus undulatus TaxID=8520 RepID=UPI001C4AADA7|nr:F-box only protein 27 [Sceloporus undulatus]XP_042296618.1 F-box only protein 27 [Sceloporus undulatus]XP_042296619.1 F-box only protein 27 [Sceloporus undulatus]XP_042296620.1 F-box only protein 27 [Sceloporus undulatus]
MGPVKSKRISVDLPCKMEIQPMEDLKLLPDELLELILSWVPSRTLVRRCRLVCRKWRDLIDRPTIWKLQWERDPSKKATLEAAKHCPPMDWCRVGVLQPFGRNLIKNPCGKEQFRHWEVQHGGDKWKVEDNRGHVEGAEAQSCFVSSFLWCAKSQVIDLLKEGFWEELLDTYQPDIFISDWWCAREDCGYIYKIQVSLLAADRTSVIAIFAVEPDPIPRWNDSKYQQISHVFRNYGPGVRYVYFKHAGRDSQYWAGHYGARVTNSTVLVEFSPEPP